MLPRLYARFIFSIFSKALFYKATEFRALVSSLATPAATIATAIAATDAAILILEKYQEQPNLLDMHLEVNVQSLLLSIRRVTTDNVVRTEMYRLLYTVTKVTLPT